MKISQNTAMQNIGERDSSCFEATKFKRSKIEDGSRFCGLVGKRQELAALLDRHSVLVYRQKPDYSILFDNYYFEERFGEPEDRRWYEILRGLENAYKPCSTFRVIDTQVPNKESRLHELMAIPLIYTTITSVISAVLL
jgi:hypothetical protein